MLEKHGTRYHPAFVADQIFERLEFAEKERNFARNCWHGSRLSPGAAPPLQERRCCGSTISKSISCLGGQSVRALAKANGLMR
jgi:hypothetical protein